MSALFVLLAPFVVAVAAWVGHVVVRGTKISELRQKWVDDQRSDLAIIVSRAYALERLRSAGTDLEETRVQALTELEEAAFRVKLRENPRKPEWTETLVAVDRLRNALDGGPVGRADIASFAGAILAQGPCRFKAEWTTVRDGEYSYVQATRVFRRVALGLLAFAAGWLAVTALMPAASPSPTQVKLVR